MGRSIGGCVALAIGIVVIIGGFMALSGYGMNWVFARQIAGADRVVVSDINDGDGPKVAMSGDDVAQVINAIGMASRHSKVYLCGFSTKVEFFRGDQSLGSVLNCGSLVLINGKQYRNDSGVLDELSRRWIQERERVQMNAGSL
jgi:hypothetical protein